MTNIKAIQTVTVGAGGTANITFSSIPQTYTDLVIMISARSESAGGFSDELIKFNNTTTTYTNRYIYGNGSSALGGSNAYTGSGGFTGGMVGNTSTANTFGNKMIYIPNYTSSNKKSYTVDSVTENNATLAYMHLLAGFWDNTSAITSIVLVTDNGTDYAEYTTATLYGVSNIIASGAKAYGGTVTEDANYFYHTFLASGTFRPTQSITADILVVAGGGGAGWGGGGGGGAGGLLGFNSQSLTAQDYSITVGAGGAAGSATGGYPDLASCGGKGNSSVFGALTTVAGGGGGHGTTYPGTTTQVNGGSGGGTSGREAAGQNVGTGTSGQGNNGGAGSRVSANANEPAGGGGGAGATGGNATSTASGNGGNGSSAYSSWGLATLTGQNVSGTYWYAGGGGGGNWAGFATTPGTGGNGGGGSAALSGIAGTANTGGGGGGGMGGGAAAGAGGSGIVIIRYAK